MSLILTEQHDDIGFITLNHPEKRNALSDALVKAFMVALESAARAAGAGGNPPGGAR